jgi:hypothetical protein
MDSAGSSRRRRIMFIVFAALALELAALRSRGYKLGGRVIVRCQSGHLYSTIWIPGASVKSLRFGLWRVQRCPVGAHWSVVTPVQRATLSGRQLRAARKKTDVRVP